jgi:hypothetical protein
VIDHPVPELVHRQQEGLDQNQRRISSKDMNEEGPEGRDTARRSGFPG